MHVIIGTLIAIASLIYWLGRASQGAREVADVAQEVANLPRKLRHRRKAGKQGLDLIEEPVEAATVLMLSVARMDGHGDVSKGQEKAIARELIDNMHLRPEDAEDMVLQMQSLTHNLAQADTPLFKMIKLLQSAINKDEARDLVTMMQTIGGCDGDINDEQSGFIRRYEERMGLLH